LKCTSDNWEEMHRVAHSLGLRTTATMMFAAAKNCAIASTISSACGAFRRIRAGSPRSFPGCLPRKIPPFGKKVQETTAVRLPENAGRQAASISTNIDHIQSSWLTPGIKVCQIGLQFGADDVAASSIEENVVFAAGVKNRTNEGELRPHHCPTHGVESRSICAKPPA